MQGPGEVFEFRVVLLEVAPPVWRTILVPGTYSFWDLHVAIQDSMTPSKPVSEAYCSSSKYMA